MVGFTCPPLLLTVPNTVNNEISNSPMLRALMPYKYIIPASGSMVRVVGSRALDGPRVGAFHGR